MNTAILHKLLSLVLVALAAAFALCAGAGVALGDAPGDRPVRAFLYSAALAAALALVFHMLGRRGQAKLFRREALCAIGLSWIVASLVGAVPYLLTLPGCAIADAVFESASGFTTTGATSFANFHEFPPALLLWRSMSQWIGGIGVVVFFVALLSSLGAGAKILFSNESSGTAADFDQGRIQSGALSLMLYYLGLSAACAAAYRIAGMDWFRAINHAMTTIATGGFGTEAKSLAAFENPAVEWVAIVFMCLGATTFLFVIRLLCGRFHALRDGREIVGFYTILAISSALLVLYLVDLTGDLPDHTSVRAALFQAVSITTTTGYTTADFDAWLPPAKMLLVILMFIGGCSGSTAGGVKVVRMVVALRAAARSIRHAFRPNVAIPMRVGGRVLSEQAIHSVTVFLILAVALQVGAMLVVSALEPHLSFIGVFSCVQATLFNIGPGFDAVGPTENFQFLRGPTKYLLSLLMILGRLELYAVLVLLSPGAWKRFA